MEFERKLVAKNRTIARGDGGMKIGDLKLGEVGDERIGKGKRSRWQGQGEWKKYVLGFNWGGIHGKPGR